MQYLQVEYICTCTTVNASSACFGASLTPERPEDRYIYAGFSPERACICNFISVLFQALNEAEGDQPAKEMRTNEPRSLT